MGIGKERGQSGNTKGGKQAAHPAHPPSTLTALKVGEADLHLPARVERKLEGGEPHLAQRNLAEWWGWY